ncbi:hypothetical protein M601_020400 [Cellulophaga baltica 4]|nr:hypothetical protein M601_020400 [Cellulophaga baltica 4]
MEPQDTIIFDGNSGSISVTASNTAQYQWQISTDGGTSFSDIIDFASYTGIQTATLTIHNANMEFNGLEFRVILSNEGYVCSSPIISTSVVLDIKIKTMITNRKITYRIHKA